MPVDAGPARRDASSRSPSSRRRRAVPSNAVPRMFANRARLLAGREAMRDLDDLPLAVAEHEQIRARVEQDRAPHLLLPIVEVRDAAQARLDAADDDRRVRERLAHALRVDDHAAVRPLAADAVRRVRIVAAHALVGRVAVDHRVHVAGRDAEEERRRARAARSRAVERQSGCAMMPTRKPCASSTRPTMAMPKLGWST